MSVEANKETARRLISQLETGKIDTSMLADSFTMWTAITGEMSREQYLGFGVAVPAVFTKPLELHITEMTAEGNRVAVQVHSGGELKTGVPYRNNYHFLFEFEGGKIVRMREHMDTKHASETLAVALGA